jgi:hypothetical protein
MYDNCVHTFVFELLSKGECISYELGEDNGAATVGML